jgi:uncharacterized protein
MNTPPTRTFDAPDLLMVGPVRHRRLRPARNAFSYGVYTLRLPLRARAEKLACGTLPDTRLFAHNRFGLLSFHDSDHGDAKRTPLEWIESVLREADIHDVDGEIFLHTFPRVLGHVFNPVSFWFCERADGSLRAVLCEVNNTFGERHSYLLDPGRPLPNGMPLTARKVLHVSPFCEVQGQYTFRFMFAPPKHGRPLRSLARIDYDDGDGPVLLTSIAGTARPLDTWNVLRVFVGYPLMTVGVLVKIHWQALKLFFKRVPFLAKPKPPSAHLSHERAELPSR